MSVLSSQCFRASALCANKWSIVCAPSVWYPPQFCCSSDTVGHVLSMNEIESRAVKSSFRKSVCGGSSFEISVSFARWSVFDLS